MPLLFTFGKRSGAMLAVKICGRGSLAACTHARMASGQKKKLTSPCYEKVATTGWNPTRLSSRTDTHNVSTSARPDRRRRKKCGGGCTRQLPSFLFSLSLLLQPAILDLLEAQRWREQGLSPGFNSACAYLHRTPCAVHADLLNPASHLRSLARQVCPRR